MKKKLLYTTILVAIISLVIGFSKGKLGLKGQGEEESKISQEVKFDYKNNMQILSYMDGFIIYDGNELILKDDKFSDKFNLRLKTENFVIKTSNDGFVYLLDRSDRILYKVDSSGTVVTQAKFIENASDIYPLENGDLIVHYTTSVNTDGIIIYDKNLQVTNNISYPNGLVSDISYDAFSKKTLISVQMLDYTQIINAIYLYDSRYEVQEIKQFKNLVTTNIKITKDKIFLADPQAIYIMDKNLEATKKIEAQDSFSNMEVVDGKIYLQDGAKQIKVYDKDATLLEEMVSDEPINKIYFKNSKPIFLGKNFITYDKENDKEKIDIKKDVLDCVMVKDKKMFLFFRNAYQIVNI